MVQLTSVATADVEVTVRIQSHLALKVGLSGMPTHCYVNPVYEHYHKLQPGRVQITARRGSDSPETVTVTAGSKKQWLVIYGQEGFPLRMMAQDKRPLWAA